MRGVVLTVAAAAALTFASAAVAVVVASASGSGSITFGSSREHILFDATRSDDGTVTGEAFVVDHTAEGLVRLRIAVNCLNVIGNVAIVSGLVTSSTDESLVGMEAVFEAVDTGQGGGETRDQMSLVNLHDPGVGSDCTVPSEFDLAPVDGNITVTG
jgi:hypothetical protein